MSLLQYIESSSSNTANQRIMASSLRTHARQIVPIKELEKMPIFSFLQMRRVLQGLLGGANRRVQTGPTGRRFDGWFRKAALAGITAMIVKRMLRRKSL